MTRYSSLRSELPTHPDVVVLLLLIVLPAACLVVVAAFVTSKGGLVAAIATVIVVWAFGRPTLGWVRVRVWDPDPGCDVECDGRLVFYVAWYAYIAAAVIGSAAVAAVRAGRVFARSSGEQTSG